MKQGVCKDMSKQKLSTQPYKGTRDFYPEEMQKRNYIFSVWKKVCKRYGFEEYDGPMLEDFEIYAVKSGEEIVNEQLYSLEDKSGRKLAIRPEMTPTAARMIAQKYKQLVWPVKWFSIPNLWRYESPQRGRLREHYQLNVDIFGPDNVIADLEIIMLAIDIMKEFGATEKMFEIRIGNRRLLDDVLFSIGIPDTNILGVMKAIDKKSKISQKDFEAILEKDAGLENKQINLINDFLNKPVQIINSISNDSKGAKEVKKLMNLLEISEYNSYVKFDPTITRGFDYYTGNVFEQFDLNPDNNRSMYGGGRYDNLVGEFVSTEIPGVGMGMGDVTMELFLQNWNLLPKLSQNLDYLVTLWPNDPNNEYLEVSLKVASELRKLGKNVQNFIEPDTKLEKQLKYADRKGFSNVIIIGEEELTSGSITVKSLGSGKQETKSLATFLNELE